MSDNSQLIKLIGVCGNHRNHPGFYFAIIPDVIDGSVEENDDLLAEWPFFDGVPVYHLHEPLERLLKLTNSYSRIALGSSGSYRCTCTLPWWDQIVAIMTCCVTK